MLYNFGISVLQRFCLYFHKFLFFFNVIKLRISVLRFISVFFSVFLYPILQKFNVLYFHFTEYGNTEFYNIEGQGGTLKGLHFLPVVYPGQSGIRTSGHTSLEKDESSKSLSVCLSVLSCRN